MVSLNSLRKRLKADCGALSDVDVIIMDTLKIDKSRLFLDIPVNTEQEKQITDKAQRLKSGEPLGYIIGHQEFMSMNFYVNSCTLIPRGDTEVLVEYIINYYKGKAPLIFEIGTGSGCIAVSLAKYLPSAQIIACDISKEALKVAESNAKRHLVNNRITFLQHDIMQGYPKFEEKPCCVVSNPPYIESETIKTLDPSVKDFEPISALDGGLDGLDFYRQIINLCPLGKDGLLAFEIGYNQGEKVKNLMQSAFSHIQVIKDFANHDRIVAGTRK